MNHDDEIKFAYTVGCLVGLVAASLIFLFEREQPGWCDNRVQPNPPQLEVLPE